MSRVDLAVLGGLALLSVGLLFWATGNVVLAAGFLAGLAIAAGGTLLARRLFPKAAAGEAALPDWTMLRVAVNHDDVAVAVTDRGGRLVCANDLFATWFGGFVTPPGLPVDARGAEALKNAGRTAWRDGEGVADDIAVGPLQLRAHIFRTGQAEDYLVWRFSANERLDLATEIVRHLDGPAGLTLAQAGVMAALVSAEGRLRSANRAFLLRALDEADQAHYVGRDVSAMLRLDEAGSLYFAREGDRATPVRMIQIPLAPADTHGPVLLTMLDEEIGPADRGTAQAYVETLLSLLPFGLALVDRDGRFLYMNRAFKRAGNVGEGRMPRYPGDLVVGEDKGPLADMIRRHSSGQQVGGDLSIRLVGQGDDPVSMRVVGVRGLGEAAVLLSLKDSSEESRLKRQVAQASKMQAVGQLAGGVAHDFNNILTAVLGSCDLMLMRHTPGDSDYDDIQQIRSNANRAASLTRQLLAFSRQQTLRPQILQLPDVISEVSHLLKRLIGDTVHLSVHHGRGLGAVRADPGQLEQVIINLAVNARDAMPGGGTLTIETYPVSAADVRQMGSEFMPPADYSALKVSDTGTGIPADVLPKIFEPFFTTKDVGKGTGLGLSTVYGIIKQSAGFIFADSKPGKTSFTIYLPVHRAEHGAPATPTPVSKPKKSQWGTGTILLVEDEDMVRAVAERALARAGYTVVTASQGEEGLERFAGMEKVDLVVSDVVMPTMDGPAMVREMRKKRPALPVLFMSGYAEEQLRQSINIDDVAFLPKPFSVAQLAEAVSAALDNAAHRASDG
ncbi:MULTISPECIES: response regulator [unclassified Sphingopyxis]|uniref:hybrid sensor histidine kinase/response regulator n=1 Tax=unclassified Sphingopyxis TaxID=2614943 RepID=UPI000731AD0A|nr:MULTISPECIES: response regulator [unclassified Sphingopyxis]KTE25242.1 hybrid sensor histidine kinase/response regulator [Sphingopyxis sp. H057]KTE53839.1 hybrid sensor histidine kinase/response regulator [Sphingopyxis sp. H073]KTE55955.1 hybrid sensor histidine kinase/response regulator [Sphingopyxis sp. H107]KTE56431.1 hybrid sensor histidine kinase/response regulator [Sphingopyxis sp. H071]KTE67393.1 hybrid sensor histidine kinase/response regulator [Sphingopyxis sp. H100]